MKKIKKLLAVIAIGLVVGGGLIQLSTVQASACSYDFGCCYFQFGGMGNYPGIIFSKAMVNQYSSDVSTIQLVLNSIGYSPGKADGYYGDLTYNAVCAFQEFHHLTRDGKVGPQTWTALKAHCY